MLDLLMRWPARSGARLVCIKGNHEEVMAAAAEDEAAEAKWLTMSGANVLAQYGVRRAAELPADVLAWLRALPMFCDDGLRYFVHAGADPAKPLSAQTPDIQMSMRGEFLTEDHDFGRHIVHGHTPQLDGKPDLRRFRTNLDTNVSQTGRLTAAQFDDRTSGPKTILATTSNGAVEIRELRHSLEMS